MPETATGQAHTVDRLWHDGLVIYGNYRIEVARTLAVANARRLVACWNAAHDAGLSTEALEDGAVKAAVKAAVEAAEGSRKTLGRLMLAAIEGGPKP